MIVASYVILFALLIICSYTDLTKHKIYNVITLPTVLIGIVLGLLINYDTEFISRLTGFAIGFGLFTIFFVFKALGGGDVKLIGAVGALIGTPLIFDAIILSMICAGIISIFILIIKKRFVADLGILFRNIFKLKQNEKTDSKLTIAPFGFCIACGTMIAVVNNLAFGKLLFDLVL